MPVQLVGRGQWFLMPDQHMGLMVCEEQKPHKHLEAVITAPIHLFLAMASLQRNANK